jgi:hypothetical protein
MTNDLWEALEALKSAAYRYTPSNETGVPKHLIEAAVAFTIQLAIEAGRSSDEAHELERAVISKLGTWHDEWGAMTLRLVMTHDMSCVLSDLARAARRYALPQLVASESAAIRVAQRIVPRDLTVAAVAFTIQLGIEDAPDSDLGALRAMEREMISTLDEPCEFGKIPLCVDVQHGETWGALPSNDDGLTKRQT